MSGRRLPRSFYARAAHEVAPDLVGRDLVRTLPDGSRLVARILETEAYGPADPASHAFRGRTRRNATMFGRPGLLYVYFTYGMHWCMNAVTGAPEEGSAVLLRTATPLEGLDRMALARGRSAVRDLCSGPAKLAQALGVDGALDGSDLTRGGPVGIHEGEPAPRIATGPRVGISVARDVPWRFFAEPSC